MNTQINLNQEELYDVYGTWHIPFWQTTAFKLYVVLFISVCIALILFFIIKKKLKKRQLSAQVIAHNALKILADKKVGTQEDAHDIYFKLTDILKQFFQAKLAMPFASMSDNEMIISLQKTSVPSTVITSLQTLVKASENVKYAQEGALQKDIADHIQTGITIVDHITTNDSKQ